MANDPLFEQFGKVFKKDDVIFRENDMGEVMFLIRKGRIRIYKTFLEQGNELSEGKKLERELVVLESGDFFGEMSLLNGEPRAATATVIEDSEVLEINRSTFESMIKTNGNFALKIISKLCERVINTDKIIEEILIHYKQRTILDTLLSLEEEHKEGIPLTIVVQKIIEIDSRLKENDIKEIINKLSKYEIIIHENDLIKIPNSKNLANLKGFLES